MRATTTIRVRYMGTVRTGTVVTVNDHDRVEALSGVVVDRMAVHRVRGQSRGLGHSMGTVDGRFTR
jgi:hypothetical protein